MNELIINKIFEVSPTLRQIFEEKVEAKIQEKQQEIEALQDQIDTLALAILDIKEDKNI